MAKDVTIYTCFQAIYGVNNNVVYNSLKIWDFCLKCAGYFYEYLLFMIKRLNSLVILLEYIDLRFKNNYNNSIYL